jgi:hypothetical protein
MTYFKNLPTINYNGVICKNIIARSIVSDTIRTESKYYNDVTLDYPLRYDTIAKRYYDEYEFEFVSLPPPALGTSGVRPEPAKAVAISLCYFPGRRAATKWAVRLRLPLPRRGVRGGGDGGVKKNSAVKNQAPNEATKPGGS